MKLKIAYIKNWMILKIIQIKKWMNSSKNLNEIIMTVQDMIEEFIKVIEILKKSNWNSGSKKLNKSDKRP
jgi:hypothetical protein